MSTVYLQGSFSVILGYYSENRVGGVIGSMLQEITLVLLITISLFSEQGEYYIFLIDCGGEPYCNIESFVFKLYFTVVI